MANCVLKRFHLSLAKSPKNPFIWYVHVKGSKSAYWLVLADNVGHWKSYIPYPVNSQMPCGSVVDAIENGITFVLLVNIRQYGTCLPKEADLSKLQNGITMQLLKANIILIFGIFYLYDIQMPLPDKYLKYTYLFQIRYSCIIYYPNMNK